MTLSKVVCKHCGAYIGMAHDCHRTMMLKEHYRLSHPEAHTEIMQLRDLLSEAKRKYQYPGILVV